jgi:hypothetical protein
MTARRCRLEFKRIRVDDDPWVDGPTHTEWFWRFISSNGSDELARSSETYRRRVDAISCAETVTGCYGIRELEQQGYCHRVALFCQDERVDVRWIR